MSPFFMASPTNMFDRMSPSLGCLPVAVPANSPNCKEPVMHFEGHWRVGSLTVNEGLVVQSFNWALEEGRKCTWQKALGSAWHR